MWSCKKAKMQANRLTKPQQIFKLSLDETGFCTSHYSVMNWPKNKRSCARWTILVFSFLKTGEKKQQQKKHRKENVWLFEVMGFYNQCHQAQVPKVCCTWRSNYLGFCPFSRNLFLLDKFRIKWFNRQNHIKWPKTWLKMVEKKKKPRKGW